MGYRPNLEGGTKREKLRQESQEQKRVLGWWLCYISRKQNHGQHRRFLRVMPGSRRSAMRRPRAQDSETPVGTQGTRNHSSLPLSTLRLEGPWMMGSSIRKGGKENSRKEWCQHCTPTPSWTEHRIKNEVRIINYLRLHFYPLRL